jgi:hypothetical protein
MADEIPPMPDLTTPPNPFDMTADEQRRWVERMFGKGVSASSVQAILFGDGQGDLQRER